MAAKKKAKTSKSIKTSAKKTTRGRNQDCTKGSDDTSTAYLDRPHIPSLGERASVVPTEAALATLGRSGPYSDMRDRGDTSPR